MAWLVLRRHQAITWTNVNFLLIRYRGIHPRAIPQETLKIIYPSYEFDYYSIKITAASLMGQRVSIPWLAPCIQSLGYYIYV